MEEQKTPYDFLYENDIYEFVNDGDYSRIEKAMQSYSDQQNAELREQLASEIESREHWQRQARRYQKYHRELNAALERAKELEAENARYRDRIGEALKFLQSRQQTTPGLGAPVTILKQALEK